MSCRNSIEPYKCETCPLFRTHQLSHLKEHWREPLSQVPSIRKSKSYNCEQCQLHTYSNFLFIIHTIHNNCVRRKVYKKQKSEQENAIQCQYCLAKFKFKNNLERHMSFWHHCKHCMFKAESKDGLEQHLLHEHYGNQCTEYQPEKKHFVCQHCMQDFRYNTNSELQAHLKRYHTKCQGLQWFKCDQCQFRSIVQGSLMDHIQRVHKMPQNTSDVKKQVPQFQCDICPAEFVVRADLKSHMICSHSKPKHLQFFKCVLCRAKFKTKENLINHVNSMHQT